MMSSFFCDSRTYIFFNVLMLDYDVFVFIDDAEGFYIMFYLNYVRILILIYI